MLTRLHFRNVDDASSLLHMCSLEPLLVNVILSDEIIANVRSIPSVDLDSMD